MNDEVFCVDGCGQLADTERPYGVAGDDLIVDLVCADCARNREGA